MTQEPASGAEPTASVPMLFAVTPDGAQRVELPRPVHDVHEIFDGLPVGIYEAFRLLPGKRVFRLGRYLRRAAASARLLGLQTRLEEDSVREALADAADQWPDREARVRLDVFPRPAPELYPGTSVFLSFSRLPSLPPGVLEKGVVVGIASGKQRRQPRAKNAAWVLERRGTGPGDQGKFEHLLLGPDQEILECTSANFFAIRQDALWTAAEGVLEGICRELVLEIARARRIPVHLQPVRRGEVHALQGAFLTSSSRGPIPIQKVEETVVGDGRPPPLFAAIREFYEEWIDDEAESLRPAQA